MSTTNRRNSPMRKTKDCHVNTWYWRLVEKWFSILPMCDERCRGHDTCQVPKCNQDCNQGRNCDCDGSHHAKEE